jgi:hypothetical protein
MFGRLRYSVHQKDGNECEVMLGKFNLSPDQVSAVLMGSRKEFETASFDNNKLH